MGWGSPTVSGGFIDNGVKLGMGGFGEMGLIDPKGNILAITNYFSIIS